MTKHEKLIRALHDLDEKTGILGDDSEKWRSTVEFLCAIVEKSMVEAIDMVIVAATTFASIVRDETQHEFTVRVLESLCSELRAKREEVRADIRGTCRAALERGPESN